MSEQDLKRITGLIEILDQSIKENTQTIEPCSDIIRTYYDDLIAVSKEVQKRLETEPEAYNVYQTHYGYKKVLIHRTTEYEIYIIIWDPNSKTPVHDHSTNGCLMMCLNNSLKQTIFTNGNTRNQIKTDIINAGDISYIDNKMGLHMITNHNLVQTESVHIYSPPSYKANIYN
jgi:predicted metal-dependent enzyme (double-stranded beta helix superfamily)